LSCGSSGTTAASDSLPAAARFPVLGDTLGDHDGDTLGDEIRLVSPDMKAPVATSLAMGAGS